MAHSGQSPYLNESAQASAVTVGTDYGDPFADRPRQTQFAEQTRPSQLSSPMPQPFESATSLPHEFGGARTGYDDEEVPLNTGQTFTGGFYPPK